MQNTRLKLVSGTVVILACSRTLSKSSGQLCQRYLRNSREREINNIEEWSRVNNLTLNQSKSAEIVFTDSRKRRLVQPPPPIQRIARVTSLKVLGVTVTEKLSVTEHVDDVINSMCAVHDIVCHQCPAYTACAHHFCSRFSS